MKASEFFTHFEKEGAYEVNGLGYMRNLFTLCEIAQAKSVLEIGTGWGYSTAAFAASLSNREGVRLVTVDTSPEILLPKNASFVSKTHVPCQVITSSAEHFRTQSQFDLLYIDIAPDRDMIDRVFNKFRHSVTHDGFIIVDGYGGQTGVTDFVDRSPVSFMMLPYSDTYCHAVYRNPPNSEEMKRAV